MLVSNNLEEKYNQHLQWVDILSLLLYDEDVAHIDLETNPYKYSFGKRFYGSFREEIERLEPQLLERINEKEQPHKDLHETVVRIIDLYEPADYILSIFLQSIKVGHYL
jgi:methyl-accepting chemotaxis protein